MSGDTITIPEDALPLVRTGAYNLIGGVTEAISDLVDGADREAHELDHRAQLAKLLRVYALLDAIGWRSTVATEPTLAVAVHGRTLCEAVDDLFAVALNGLEEATPETHAKHVQRVRTLCRFGQQLESVDGLPSRDDPCVRATQKRAERLLAEAGGRDDLR